MPEELPENLDLKDLENWQKEIEERIRKIKKQDSKSRFRSGIQKAIDSIPLPVAYSEYLESLQNKEPKEILDSIISNDNIVSFPLLIVLTCVWPIDEVMLRKILIQLFESYVLYQGPGLNIGSVLEFPTDRILRACESSEGMATVRLLDEQIIDLRKFNFGPQTNNDIVTK